MPYLDSITKHRHSRRERKSKKKWLMLYQQLLGHLARTCHRFKLWVKHCHVSPIASNKRAQRLLQMPPMDCSPPGSSVHGTLQARILEWGAMSSCRGSSPPRDQAQVSHITGRFFTSSATREAQKHWSASVLSCFSCVWLFVTLWTVAW